MSYQPPFDWMSWDLGPLTEDDKPPPSVSKAVRLMYAGAAIDALRLIFTLAAFRSLLWSDIAGVSTLEVAELSGVGYIVVVFVTRIGMWLWMASRSNAGRRWARVVSTVCLVIDSLLFVDGIARLGLEWQVLSPLAAWLIGVCAVALLWQRGSSEFFTARSQRY